MTTVVNVKDGLWVDGYFDVFIGRPSKWGNPFIIGRDGDRLEVIEKYQKWLKTQPHLLGSLDELRGKRLGCFCSPLPCHGDILRVLADTTGIIED